MQPRFTIAKIIFFILATGLVTQNCTQPREKSGIQPVGTAVTTSKLSFTDSQKGDTSIIFIHGWNIDKTYWQPQVDYFSKNYRVLTIDLPGYGKSPVPAGGCSAEEFSKDILQLCSDLSVQNMVVVGHSMSGAIVTEMATQSPDKILTLVGIDNFTQYDTGYSEKTKKELAAFFNKMRTNYRETVKPFIDNYLTSPSTDSAVKNRLYQSMLRPDSVFSVDCLQKIDSYSLGKKLKALNRPLYLINSNFHPNDTASFRKNGIELHFYNIGPTGHYPMIEKPAEFNRLLHTIILRAGK